MKLTTLRERIAVDAIRWAPKGLMTAAIGWSARTRLPRRLRSPMYRAFARWAGADLDEAELPLSDYPTLGHFFARRLRPGVRSVIGDEDVVISPCDGVVAARGVADAGHMIQAKGRGYSLAELVVDADLAARLEGGPYLTIYLSPRDYHRVHAAVPAKYLGYDYVPGTFFPVNPLFARSVDGLMARNERVVFHFHTDVGAACLIMVGALGVSNVEIVHDRMETRRLRPSRSHREVRFDEPLDLGRGDELGAFHLGSTTILIFEPNSIALNLLDVGDPVRFGQPVGHVIRAAQTAPVGSDRLGHATDGE